MFIGHFALAYAIHYFLPIIPLWVVLVGVSFPDLLWPILVILGIEKVYINSKLPLQKDIRFNHYPYSHSLVLSTAIATAFGGAIAILLNNNSIFFLFPLFSASHWFLDAIVHRKDLPVLGFSKKDIKVGLGLWNHGRAAFVSEYIIYVILTMVFAPSSSVFSLLVLGTIFHVANINSFLGLSKINFFAKGKYTYPIITLIGFSLFIILATI
jgi:hypothetical protein